MTNFEKIKIMNTEEMVEWLVRIFELAVTYDKILSIFEHDFGVHFQLNKALKKWLESEANDE